MHIGKYRILGLLGKGGMGRVYKAELPVVGKVVALKLLQPHEHMIRLLGSAAVEELFIREAQTLAQIRHPNVASILDFDRDRKDRPFFVMEYHCMNLGDIIGEHYVMESSTRIIPPDKASWIGAQVLSGLDRLHHGGILHRDIKPYNILIDETGVVKIIDFGLSLLRSEYRSVPDNFKIGTPYYAAPEQERDPDRIDVRADLYGVGALMWRILTGYLPPDVGKKPRPSDLNPLLGSFWDGFLTRATHRDSEKRFSDCMEMQAALKAAHESWGANLEQACRIESLETSRRDSPARLSRLRHYPQKVSKREALTVFDLTDLWRPRHYRKADFRQVDADRVEDSAHGLVWQQAGSRYPVSWRAAHAYVDTLNETTFGGIRDWRLPTIDELLTQIRPAGKLGDYCVPALFDSGKQRLWSADRKSYTAAWYADTEMGYVGSADFTCRCHVRAVSGPAAPEFNAD